VQEFNSQGVKFAYITAGKDFSLDSPIKKTGTNDLPLIIWAHGWGQSHSAFQPLITPLEPHARHIAIDFPGFGESPPPPESWGTQDYADAVAAWMKEKNLPPVIWIGHSFGCRVGAQLAARHPECIQSMAFIAGAGLKRKRPLHTKIYYFCRIKLFKCLKKFVPDGAFKTKLMGKFGSADYNSAGAMRKIFVRVVNEDLTAQAQSIQCPVALIYGRQDTETPPEFGERYSRLINHSKLFLLDGQDHYSVLQNGRHQVIKIIDDFIKERTL
tara:strand:+ start:6191 stop:7000 length:810 start_codon:yes stop_codon:yes gene_type:complete